MRSGAAAREWERTEVWYLACFVFGLGIGAIAMAAWFALTHGDD